MVRCSRGGQARVQTRPHVGVERHVVDVPHQRERRVRACIVRAEPLAGQDSDRFGKSGTDGICDSVPRGERIDAPRCSEADQIVRQPALLRGIAFSQERQVGDRDQRPRHCGRIRRPRDRRRKRAFVGVARAGDPHVEDDVGCGGRRGHLDRAAGLDQIGDRRRDRREFDRIGDRAAARARIDDAYARLRVGFACQRGGEQRHREFVGAGLDRSARRRQPASGERAQRGQVAEMQSNRAGIILSEHDAVETALRRRAQREQIDIAVARAHVEIRIQCRAELRAQALGGCAVLGAARRIGQRSVFGERRPHVARERKGGRRAERRQAGRRQPHHGSENVERPGPRRAERGEIVESCVCQRARDAGDARRDEAAVDGHVGRNDVGTRVGRRVVAQPAQHRVRIARNEVAAQERGRRFGDVCSGDRTQEPRQLRRYRTVVERDDDERQGKQR